MGKKPDERALRRAGAEVLARLRKRDPVLAVTKEQRARMLARLGTTPENIDTVMSLPASDEEE